MPEYRLQFLARDSGRIAHSYAFQAANDAKALAFAGVWDEDAPMELWCEDVRVKRWEHPAPPAAAPGGA